MSERRATYVSITIRVKRNGPYLISAEQADGVTVVNDDGTTLVPEPGRSIALCRCGGSSTKPFCDKTHRSIGFDGTCMVSGPSVTDPVSPTTPQADGQSELRDT